MLITQYTALLLQTTKKTALVSPTFVHGRLRSLAAISVVNIPPRSLITGLVLVLIGSLIIGSHRKDDVGRSSH
ncbi:unnamed protein product [Nezara viridula]|uniref:Uncharacterized protein n=1 Tax=Nezara viridula TaxID=85310 RepID=A0A9P0E797_NEZVI|nr:unnamed protein product [Nezara viridula]